MAVETLVDAEALTVLTETLRGPVLGPGDRGYHEARSI